MTPDVVVDVGNSRIKWGWRLPTLIELKTASLPPDSPEAWSKQLSQLPVGGPVSWAAAGVHPDRLTTFRQWVEARGEQLIAIERHAQVPIPVEVDEPSHIGIDRLLNAAAYLRYLPTGTAGVIIDIGTAATIDLIDERHVFVGGAILPGPRLMFESLHRQTAKLPLIDLHKVPNEEPPGKNTRDAMTVGVMAAQYGAADFLIREYAKLCRNQPWVMMTGGALGYLADYDFEGVGRIQTNRALTLDGIRIAAEALP